MILTNEDILVNLDKYPVGQDLKKLFIRRNPVHIEVGSGKGTFLVHQACQHPEVNYLGLEWANKYYRYSVDRMRRRQITNVRILRTDARDFIRIYVPEGNVAGLHIYFPDPWPKKRHHKRRFFAPETIKQVARILTVGGEFRTATDHADYFAVMQEVMLGDSEIATLFEETAFYPVDTADVGEWVGSNFERKYLKEGRKIYTLALRKK